MTLNIQLVERPTINTKTALESVKELTYSTFSEKGLKKELASNLLKSVGNCYNFLILDEKEYDAEQFLRDYKDALTAIHNIKEKTYLQRIVQTLEKWLIGVNNVYKETKNIDLYLDGQMRMFKAIFGRFNQSLTKMLISAQQEELLDTFNKKPEESLAA